MRITRRGLLGWSLAALAVPSLAPPPLAPRQAAAEADDGTRLAAAARAQIGVTLIYDPAYVRLAFPGGDLDRRRGVCADVIIRAYRDAFALDLQALVHRDMTAAFARYPSRRTWGLARPDRNIDHRRVLNLEVFLERRGARLWRNDGAARDGTAFAASFAPGDLLTWRLDGRLPHIAILGEAGDAPTVIHNIGLGTQEEPLALLAPHLPVAHYRWTAVTAHRAG
jgi:uncharacterized protein YijF (DUF1287 family)